MLLLVSGPTEYYGVCSWTLRVPFACVSECGLHLPVRSHDQICMCSLTIPEFTQAVRRLSVHKSLNVMFIIQNTQMCRIHCNGSFVFFSATVECFLLDGVCEEK